MMAEWIKATAMAPAEYALRLRNSRDCNERSALTELMELE